MVPARVQAGFSLRSGRDGKQIPSRGGRGQGWRVLRTEVGIRDPLVGSIRQAKRPLATTLGRLDFRHLGFQGHTWGMEAQRCWISRPSEVGRPPKKIQQ